MISNIEASLSTPTNKNASTTSTKTLLDHIFKSVVFPGQAFRGLLESLMLIYDEEYAKKKKDKERNKVTVHLNFQKMDHVVKSVGATVEEAKRCLCTFGWLQIIIGDDSPGISSVPRIVSMFSFPSSTRNASDLKLFATMKMCTMRLAKNLLLLSKHENGFIVALLSTSYLKSVNEKHSVCYPLVVEYVKTVRKKQIVYVQTQTSRTRGHLESVLKFSPYCREIMLHNLIKRMPETGLMHILYDLRGPAPIDESQPWGKSSFGNMSVAEFDLIMRREDVVFLNSHGQSFSLDRAGVPEGTTFQEECSLRKYLEIMRLNDDKASSNVNLALREVLVRREDPRSHIRVDVQPFRLIVKLGTTTHVAMLTLGYRERRDVKSKKNIITTSTTTTTTSNNTKRGTWTRYNGGIHCYSNNRLIAMYERVGFQRFCVDTPGHEVFGVLEADFLPVKLAWIEYERRSVLFQLVMKAMRMAVHKYYYEIQTTYMSALTTKLQTLIKRGSNATVPIDIQVEQDSHTMVKLAALRRTARRHSREIFYRRIQTSTGYFKSRHPLLTSNYDGCVERDAYQKLMSLDQVNVAVAAAGQMASLDRSIQCALIQHDGSVCQQEKNDKYGTWTVLRPSLNLRVRCICKQGPAAWMIQCNVCSFWCHGMCEGFSHENRPSSFACAFCRMLDPTLDSEDARPRYMLKNHRHRRVVVELLILENEAPNGAFNIPTGRRQWISEIQSISSLKELRDCVVETEGLINLNRVPSRIRHSWLQRRADWRTRLLSLRRPKLTSLVSAVDEMRMIVAQIPFCDICGSGVYNDLNPIVGCANIYNCAKEHWRHMSCLKRINEAEKKKHHEGASGVWYCETCIHGPYTLSDMTTTIANAKQVKIDIQKRIELDEKIDDDEDDDDDDNNDEYERKKKIPEQVSQKRTMMVVAASGSTKPSLSNNLLSSNVYPHVFIKNESSVQPILSVPVQQVLQPQQHQKPPYAQNRHLLRKAKKLNMMDSSKKPQARLLPKYDFANVFSSAASALLKLSRAGDDDEEDEDHCLNGYEEEQQQRRSDVVVLNDDDDDDNAVENIEPPSKKIKILHDDMMMTVIPTIPQVSGSGDNEEEDDDMNLKRESYMKIRRRKKLLRLMGTAKTTIKPSKLMFQHQWMWQFTCDECQYLNSICFRSIKTVTIKSGYSCKACGSTLEMPKPDIGRRVYMISKNRSRPRCGVIVRVYPSDENTKKRYCLVQLDTNEIVRLALHVPKTYLISIGIGSSVEVLRWTCVQGLRDGAEMSDSMWNFDWCAGTLCNYEIQPIQPGSNETQPMHKIQFFNGDCEWLDLSHFVTE